jgi:hypothetical protein
VEVFMASIEERLQRLEDIEAIKRLKAWYAECADAKYTPEHEKKSGADLDRIAWDQALCFTEDARWRAGPFGHLDGRQAIYESFRSKSWRFTIHFFMNPVIEVRGDEASGRWLTWLLGTDKVAQKPVHMVAYTNDTYRRVEGRWHIATTELDIKFMTDFGGAWSALPSGSVR